MGIAKYETPNHTLCLDTDQGNIIVLMRWKYTWGKWHPEMPDWTFPEKQRYHRAVKAAIWNSWNQKATLQVSGDSAFSKKFSHRQLPVFVDVRWVTQAQHWDVTVWRTTMQDIGRTSDWAHSRNFVSNQHKIVLNTQSIQEGVHCIDYQCADYERQIPVVHEVGHAFSLLGSAILEDEYAEQWGNKHVKDIDNPYYNDTGALMNIGNQLRERYFAPLLNELNQIDPGNMVFSVASLKK